MTERGKMDTLFANLDDLQLASKIDSRGNTAGGGSGGTNVPRPGKPGVKAWAVSLLALGAVAGGVIVGPQIVSPQDTHKAVAAPSNVAVSVPLQRDVADRLELLGQFSAVQQVELRAQVGAHSLRLASRMATLSAKAICSSRSIQRLMKSS